MMTTALMRILQVIDVDVISRKHCTFQKFLVIINLNSY